MYVHELEPECVPTQLARSTRPTALLASISKRNTRAFLEDINPGNSVKGIVVFDIPKDGQIVKLELHDSAFSGGVVVNV